MNKEFNLNKERKLILMKFSHSKHFRDYETGRDIRLIDIVSEVLKEVVAQDKEFIERLKEGCSSFVSAGAVCSVIDKIAGDNKK